MSTLVLLHGFTDTPRTWELVRPFLEKEQVLVPALPGHMGGARLGESSLPGAVERAMDDAGIETAHIVGNSLGGMTKPSQANEEAFSRAVTEVAAATSKLLGELVTTAPPRDREIEAEKRRARSAARFA